MVPPVIAGGKVYVGAEYAVSVFGNAHFLATPTISPNGGSFHQFRGRDAGRLHGGADIYYTLDGTTPTTEFDALHRPVDLDQQRPGSGHCHRARRGQQRRGLRLASSTAAAVGQRQRTDWGSIGRTHTSIAFTNVPFNGSPTLMQHRRDDEFQLGQRPGRIRASARPISPCAGRVGAAAVRRDLSRSTPRPMTACGCGSTASC